MWSAWRQKGGGRTLVERKRLSFLNRLVFLRYKRDWNTSVPDPVTNTTRTLDYFLFLLLDPIRGLAISFGSYYFWVLIFWYFVYVVIDLHGGVNNNSFRQPNPISYRIVSCRVESSRVGTHNKRIEIDSSLFTTNWLAEQVVIASLSTFSTVLKHNHNAIVLPTFHCRLADFVMQDFRFFLGRTDDETNDAIVLGCW